MKSQKIRGNCQVMWKNVFQRVIGSIVLVKCSSLDYISNYLTDFKSNQTSTPVCLKNFPQNKSFLCTYSRRCRRKTTEQIREWSKKKRVGNYTRPVRRNSKDSVTRTSELLRKWTMDPVGTNVYRVPRSKIPQNFCFTSSVLKKTPQWHFDFLLLVDWKNVFGDVCRGQFPIWRRIDVSSRSNTLDFTEQTSSRKTWTETP